MNTSVVGADTGIRPVSQIVGMDQDDRQPEEKLNLGDNIISRLDSIIETLRKIRFNRAFKLAEAGLSSADSSLRRLNLAIDILRKVRFTRTLEKIEKSGY